jgi:hypothetical protein
MRESADGMESVPEAVATGSRDRDPGSWLSSDPVATAPGTDLVLKLRNYRRGGRERRHEQSHSTDFLNLGCS